MSVEQPPSGVTRRRRRARLGNLALLGLTGLALVGGLEVAVRALAPQPLFAYRFDPATWYAPEPGATFDYARSEFRQRISYNALGMRDRPVSPAKPDGVIRIALLGDSYAEGLEVALEESVGRQLERRLNAGPLAPVEVVNLGVSGYSPIQSIRRIEILGPELDPDHVVFLASQNDFADNLAPRTRRLYTKAADRLEFRDVEVSLIRRFVYRSKDFFKSHLMAYQFVRDRIQSLDRSAIEAREGNAPGADELEIMTLAIRRLAGVCRSRPMTLTASMVTRKHADDPASVVPEFRDICAREAVSFVDLTPAFRAGGESGDRLFYVVDGHWNPAGHLAAATALATHLERSVKRDGSRP